MKMKKRIAASKKRRESKNKKMKGSPRVLAKMMTLKFVLIIYFAQLKFFNLKGTDYGKVANKLNII